MTRTAQEISARLRERFPEHVLEQPDAFGEVSVEVKRDALVDAAKYLVEDESFQLLLDWSCVDYLGVESSERRFLCSAHLGSVTSVARLRLRVFVGESDLVCPSLVSVWPSAECQEREMFDFFGITFEGHPNLRRIFMPDEWEGHPQRKDYPLGGVNVEYHHGAFIPPPDLRRQPTTTTGYPGRTS